MSNQGTIVQIIGVVALTVVTAAPALADEVVIKDAKTGEKFAEAVIGGEAVEVAGKLVKIERKEPSLSRQKADLIVAPVVDFDETLLNDALDYVRSRSRELDVYELDPNKKGLILIRPNGLEQRRVKELKLRNVPLSAVLDFIAEATDTKVEYTEHAIKITDAK